MKKIGYILLLLVGCTTAMQTIEALKRLRPVIVRAEGTEPRYISYRHSVPGEPLHTTVSYFPGSGRYQVEEEFIAGSEESAPPEDTPQITPQDAASLFAKYGDLYAEQENMPKVVKELSPKLQRIK